MNRGLYGIVAEFSTANALTEAARRLRKRGFRRVETFTPVPVPELEDVIRLGVNWLPLLVLLGGLVGAITGFALQEYVATVHYPINVGGRPLNSWPSFIVITFELTILFAAIAAFLGALMLSRLPAPYHPVSNAPTFESASRDKFFLCIRSDDVLFNSNETAVFLRSLGPDRVDDVPF